MPRLLPSLLVCLSLGSAWAGEIPDVDQRKVLIRHTDMQYSMPRYESLEAWKERAASLRKQVRFASGLLPMPRKTALNPQVFGRTEYGDYSIEKVLIETLPGFFLGGNLYRPIGKQGPFPGIVSPHGHWRYGRFENSERGSVPARGISMAKQGYVVLTYDMIGYNDTTQLPHGFEGPREQLWGLGMLGLQTWNSIRAVDFLLSLSDVDPQRIGATGASGGGTQTFMLSAVDDRVRFSAPVNMISGIMQGGSVCENAANLRIDTYNVEIAALMAPRPMLMVSATGDWTRNTPRDEYPAVRGIYELYDAESQLEQVQIDAPHNYNRQSREAVYQFFAKKALSTLPEDLGDHGISMRGLSSLVSLWNRQLPSHAVDQAGLIRWWKDEAEKQTASLKPSDSASLGKAKRAFRERLGLALMAEAPTPDEVVVQELETLPNGNMLALGRDGKGDRVPGVLLKPRRANPAVRPTLIVHPEGVAWVLSSSESRDGFVQNLLTRGGAVMGIDAFQTGRSRTSIEMPAQERQQRYFTTFNRTDDANRVQDILTAIAGLRRQTGQQAVNLVGMGGAGVWTVFARALSDSDVSLVADIAQFYAASDEEYVNHFFVPGIRRAGDFRAAATLLAGGPVVLHNVSAGFATDWFEASFQAADDAEQLSWRRTPMSNDEIVEKVAPRPTGRR
jgi:dienelactone hydrolase